MNQTFNVLIIDSGNSGKSAFIERFFDYPFLYNHKKHVGFTALTFSASVDGVGPTRNVTLNIYEDFFMQNVHPVYHAVFLFFDVTQRESYISLESLYRKAMQHSPGAVVVVCGNKVDSRDRVVLPSEITFPQEKNLQYYDISVKNRYNFDKPILYTLRKLLENNNLILE